MLMVVLLQLMIIWSVDITKTYLYLFDTKHDITYISINNVINLLYM